LRHVRQRVIASLVLSALSPEDTRAYIEYRLSCAGWRGDPQFTRGAHEVIYRFTGGNPRQINVFCNRLLLSSYLENIHRVDEQVVAQAAEEVLEETVIAHAPIEAFELHGLMEEFQNGTEPPPKRSGDNPVQVGATNREERVEAAAAGSGRVAANGSPARSDTPRPKVSVSTSPPTERDSGDGTDALPEADDGTPQTTGRKWQIGAVAAVVVLALSSAVYVFDSGNLRDHARAVTGEGPASGPKRAAAADDGAGQPSDQTSPFRETRADRAGREGFESGSVLTDAVAAGNHSAPAPTIPASAPDPTAQTVPAPQSSQDTAVNIAHDASPAEGGSAGGKSALQPQATAAAIVGTAAGDLRAQANPAALTADTSTPTRHASSVNTDEVRRLLRDYSDAYAAGNLEQLRGLFAQNMRSNGKSGRDNIARDYEKLFTLTDSRDMKLGGMTWRAGVAQMHGQGSFRLAVREKTLRRIARYEGRIEFDVRNTDRGPIITELNFSYDD
jgi:hypothetical protein